MPSSNHRRVRSGVANAQPWSASLDPTNGHQPSRDQPSRSPVLRRKPKARFRPGWVRPKLHHGRRPKCSSPSRRTRTLAPPVNTPTPGPELVANQARGRHLRDVPDGVGPPMESNAPARQGFCPLGANRSSPTRGRGDAEHDSIPGPLSRQLEDWNPITPRPWPCAG